MLKTRPILLSLSFLDAAIIGLENSVTVTLDETVTLTANDGFVSYEWNNNPAFDERTITIIGADLGLGTYYYSLEVENDDGCILKDSTKVIVTFAVDVQTRSFPEFSVYPNPVSGNMLNIDYSISSEASLMIYSQDGRLVSRTILLPINKNICIELPETSGIYNLVIQSKEGAADLRVLKL